MNRILLKNVIYKRYIISKDHKRQFKSVKTRGYKVWQNEITKCVRLADHKMWQQWSTKCVRCWITKCGRVGYKVRQGLQSVAGWITKCVRGYKVWQDYRVSQYNINLIVISTQHEHSNQDTCPPDRVKRWCSFSEK